MNRAFLERCNEVEATFEMSREKSAHAGLREAVRAPEPAAAKPSGEAFVRVD